MVEGTGALSGGSRQGFAIIVTAVGRELIFEGHERRGLRGAVREKGWGDGDKEKVTLELVYNGLARCARAPRSGTCRRRVMAVLLAVACYSQLEPRGKFK
jgi:hypothetical protein